MLTLVPAALVEKVRGPGMLVYGLFTGVLTTLPLLIKGIELMSIR